MRFVKTTNVRDPKGCGLVVYEFHCWRWGRKIRRFELCTGERVDAIGQSFVVVSTGETLTEVSG
jgi:hypothetical protein